MAEENLKERRKAPRFKADGEVSLVLESGVALEGTLKDLSRIGAFVALGHVNDTWAYQSAKLTLKTDVEGEFMVIKGQCALVRITPKGVGIHIFDIDVDSRKNFVRFMGHVQQPENAI
ncbi:MAG: PilZ domain-containing protein [Ketobacteraceae bacterium]|nr:PilZ domain-containing protein [Ketobacteraceae bacterium]